MSKTDASISAEEALQKVTEAGDGAEALIQSWVAERNAAAVARVAEDGSGKARKAARRALGVLKSRGVPIPERARVARVGGSPTEARVEAWMTPPDGALNTLVVIGRFPKARRGRVVFVYLNDSIGLLNVRNGEFAPSALEGEVRRLVGEHLKPFPVPLDWARSRIAAARGKNAERGLPLPLGLDSAAELLGGAPSEPPEHPFEGEGLALSDEDARELAKSSAELHRMPEFGTWLPPKQAVDEMLVEVGKTLTPGEEVSNEAMGEKLKVAIREATDRYFAPQVRERMVEAMKDSTLSVLAREGEQSALRVVATMKAIESCGLITDPPHEVPFLRAIFEKAVSVLLRQGGGKLKIPVPRAGQAAADAPVAEVEAAETTAEGESSSGEAATVDAAAPDPASK